MSQPVTITLDAGLMEYLKDVAWWSRGSYGRILADGAAQEVSALQKLHNGGRPFPPIDAAVKKVFPRSRGGKVRLTIRLDQELHEQLRRAAWHTDTSLSAIIAAGAAKEVKLYKQRHNQGRRFPKREGELPTSPKKESTMKKWLALQNLERDSHITPPAMRMVMLIAGVTDGETWLEIAPVIALRHWRNLRYAKNCTSAAEEDREADRAYLNDKALRKAGYTCLEEVWRTTCVIVFDGIQTVEEDDFSDTVSRIFCAPWPAEEDEARLKSSIEHLKGEAVEKTKKQKKKVPATTDDPR